MNQQRLIELPLSQQAGILCNDEQFRFFVGERLGLTDIMVLPTVAAEHVRHQCQIESRRELKHNQTAAEAFERLRTEFDAWRGKIPNQR